MSKDSSKQLVPIIQQMLNKSSIDNKPAHCLVPLVELIIAAMHNSQSEFCNLIFIYKAKRKERQEWYSYQDHMQEPPQQNIAKPNKLQHFSTISKEIAF